MALCAACSGVKLSDSSDESDRSDRSQDGWVIQGTEPADIFLTNGHLGIWVSTDKGIAGTGAFRFVDDALFAVPGLVVNSHQGLAEGESLKWSFDLRTGELTTERRGGSFDFSIRVVVHPEKPIAATEWAPLSPDHSVRYGYIGGAETSLPQVARDRRGSVSRIRYRASPEIPGEREPGELLLAANGNGVFGVFGEDEVAELPDSYADVLRASQQFHQEFWETDIEIDGPAEDQLAIRTMLSYLRRGATAKLPPFGASNAKYRGARFWDAEAWMLPVLVIVDREKAREATRWRIDNLGDHIAWEAAVGGRDVTPKDFGNALHVAGWVAWWTNRAKHLGLETEADEKKVLSVVFPQFYKAASDSDRGMEIKGVESPDEGRPRNNDLVTNLLAKRVARWAADHGIADGEDLERFNSIVIPTSADGTPATYDNDLLKGYQQTAALLAIYPLQEDFGEGVAGRMFDRYVDLTSEVGPAMSESIHATIAARLGRDDAYRRWRKSWQTYTDDAMMFHERRNKQDAYFMTGAAGCLQIVLYGFAGMHIECEGIRADASKSLGNGYQVAFRPNLPPEWKSLTLRNIFLGPHRATVRVTHSGVTIEGEQ